MVRTRNRAVQREHDSLFAATLSDPFRQSNLIDVIEGLSAPLAPSSELLELSHRLVEEALQTGELLPVAPYNNVPPVVETRLLELIAEGDYPILTLSMYLTMILWTQIHGIIYLEVNCIADLT